MEGCYTCRREGRVADLVIKDYKLGFVSFDLIGRPIFVYTPHDHYEQIADVPADHLKEFYMEMEGFLDEEGFRGSQISRNRGSWVTHPQRHLHWKMHAEESEVSAMRRAHLRRIQEWKRSSSR